MCFPIRVGDRFTRRPFVRPVIYSAHIRLVKRETWKYMYICTRSLKAVWLHLLHQLDCNHVNSKSNGARTIVRLSARYLLCILRRRSLASIYSLWHHRAGLFVLHMNGEIIPKGAPPSYQWRFVQLSPPVGVVVCQGLFFLNLSIFLLNRYYLCIRDSRLKVCLTV